MSIAEIVEGMSGVYYRHISGETEYPGFVDEARKLVQSDSLDYNINKIYCELCRLPTGGLINRFFQLETESGGAKPTLNRAVEYVQEVFHYSEFFIKYEMFLAALRTSQTKALFETLFDRTSSIDEAIEMYNQLIHGLGKPELRAYLVGEVQPYDLIKGRAGEKTSEVAVTRRKQAKWPARLAAKFISL